MTKKGQVYWFKRRRYGYGWYPVTWQGWLIVLVFFVVVFGGLIFVKDAPRHEYSNGVGAYLALVFISIGLVTVISYLKGPSLRWRWGKKASDNPEEDR